MRYIYVSKRGGKPLNIGMNRAKWIAHRADKRDQLTVLTQFPGLPRQHMHHQQLVRSRHRYYHEQQSVATSDGGTLQAPQGARECARRRKQMEAARGQPRAA